jgi:glyoxylate/hydroxypyruvate reductase
MFKIYVTTPMPKETLLGFFGNTQVDLVINEVLPLSRADFLKNVQGVDAVIIQPSVTFDKEALDAAGPSLKVIGTFSVGYNHIDLAECERRNVQVGFTPGILTDAVAELAMALLLSTSRRLSEAIPSARIGDWGGNRIDWMVGKGLTGATVGIFGMGRIGFAIAQRVRGFGIKKLIYANLDPVKEAEAEGFQHVDLDTLLAESDFLLCACTANKETENFFNLDKFQKMRSNAIFVNVSRGSVVNQDDLVVALKNKLIHAAGKHYDLYLIISINNRA